MGTTLRLLKNKITRALNREDIDAEELLSWVSSATLRMSSELRVAEMLTRATIPMTKNSFFLPPDYVATKTVGLLDLAEKSLVDDLVYSPPDEIKSKAINSRSGLPGYYTFYGREIVIAPFSSTNCQIDLRYFREIPQLLEDNDTNFVLDKYPEVYLNFALSYGHKFFFEEQSAQARLADALLEVQRVNDNYERDKYGGGPLIVQPNRRIGGRFS